MKKIMAPYFSGTGKAAQIAEAIAERVRFNGNAAEVMKISDK